MRTLMNKQLIFIAAFSLFIPLASLGASEKTMAPDKQLALQYKCYHWKYVCPKKAVCIDYSYSYSGCYSCKIHGYSERYKKNITDRRETCQYTRKRYFERIGYKCKQYYHSQYSDYSGDRHCTRWSRACKYICTKWNKVPGIKKS